MTRTTITTQTNPTDTRMLDRLVGRAPATDDILELSDWIAVHGPAHLNPIERIELAERLITRRRFLIGAGALGLGVITGCGPEEQAAVPTATSTNTGFPRTVTDGMGRELTLEEPPERIVAYYNDSFGMLATLGVMPVAQSVNPEMLNDPIYFGEEGENIPTITNDDGPDLEEVAAVEPDLVFVFDEEEAQALEGIAPSFVTPRPTNLEELNDAVRLFGELLGREAEAEEAISAFDDRLRAYQTSSLSDVSILQLGFRQDGSFFISTQGNPLCQVLNTLADCSWENTDGASDWGYIGTVEAVLDLNPDVIILNNWTDNSYEDIYAELADNPLWVELSAFQNERVLSTPGYDNPIASSLPALQKFIDAYIPLIYPDIFPEPLTDEEVQEILADG